MDIFSKIKNLNFNVGDYIIIGGAALAGRGIKETKDIDIFVSRDLLVALGSNSDWRHHPRIVQGEEAGLVNVDGTVELYPTMGGITFDELKMKQEMINGIPFANLHDIVKIKETYNREKDHKDIALIEEYLKLNP